MTEKTFLSERQAARLRIVLEVAEAQGTQTFAAARLKMTRQGLVGFLWRSVGHGHWPPDCRSIRKILAPPIVTEAEARARWRFEAGLDQAPPPKLDPVGGLHDRGAPLLAHDEIEQRKAARARERAEHEARWLEAERRRHGYTRQTRVGPMSRMPA